jgi:CubicO group peptidase (beta-lactamase class C family)
MDYAIFEQMLLNEGEYNGIRLLGRKAIQMMRTNQIGDLGAGSIFLSGSTDKFGLGFEVISLPGSAGVPISQGAFGWAGAFGSLYWIDPGEDLIALLVIQKLGNYTDLRNKFIATVYQAIEEVKNDD